MKPNVTLIAVADGSQARFYLHEKVGEPLRRAPFEAMAIDNPPTHRQGSDRPGRVQNRVGPGRAAMENPVDWHQQAEDRFAGQVATRIKEILAAEPGWRLVIVAAPETLGVLRQELDGALQGRLHGEVPKDFAKEPDKRLNQALAELLPVA